MPAACSSWPAVLLTIANFVMVPLCLVQTLIIRFVINPPSGGIVNVFLTHYNPEGYSYIFNNCYYQYNSNNFFSSNCPPRGFDSAYSASAGALACGIFAFLSHFVAWIIFIVYAAACCGGKKCGKGIMIAIITMISFAVFFQIVELSVSFGVPNGLASEYGSNTFMEAGTRMNIATLVLSIIILVLTCIYAKVGGRERCKCCHESTNTTTTIVLAAPATPVAATTTVTSTETVVHPQQTYVQQPVYQAPTASYPPDPYGQQPQFMAPQQQPTFYPQQQQAPQAYYQPQQGQPQQPQGQPYFQPQPGSYGH